MHAHTHTHTHIYIYIYIMHLMVRLQSWSFGECGVPLRCNTPILEPLSKATTPGHSGSRSDGNERVLPITQSSRTTGVSRSDCLGSYRILVAGCFTPLHRSSQCLLQPHPTGLLARSVCTPSLPLLPGLLWPGVVAPDMGPIYGLNRTKGVLMLNWIVWLNWIAWNRNVFHN